MNFVLPEAALRSLESQQVSKYITTAATFLVEHFAPVCGHLSDEARQDAAQLCLDDARRLGLTTERDHLKFLTVRMFLGHRFCSNPLYADNIQALGVTRSNGALLGGTALDLLTGFADQVQEKRNYDLRSVHAFDDALTTAHAACPPQPRGEDVFGLVSQIWPTVLAETTQTQFEGFARTPYNAVIKAGGTAADATVFVSLCVYFGPHLAEDPLYPWAMEILADEAPDLPTRREAVGVALVEHLKRLTSQETPHA